MRELDNFMRITYFLLAIFLILVLVGYGIMVYNISEGSKQFKKTKSFCENYNGKYVRQDRVDFCFIESNNVVTKYEIIKLNGKYRLVE